MMEPTLALQTAIRARLIATPAVTALVPAAQIVDRHTRPEASALIVIGEATADYSDARFETFYDRAHLDLHVWTVELGTEQAKLIVGAVRSAFGPVLEIPGFQRALLGVTRARFLRDPGGEYAHAVIGVDAILRELAA